MIRVIGNTLDIAEEKEITLIINGKPYHLACTPRMIKELAIGFVISEGIAKNVEDVKLETFDDVVVLETNLKPEIKFHSPGCLGTMSRFEGKIESKIKFKIDELRNYLTLLEVEEYKRTRGYHIAVVVEKNRFFRAYDVGRHNAVDKAVGLSLLNKAKLEESFLLISGRISLGIATKCANAGIPLIVSKAAIFDSAIDFCKRTGLSAVSFATNLAIGNAIE